MLLQDPENQDFSFNGSRKGDGRRDREQGRNIEILNGFSILLKIHDIELEGGYEYDKAK